MGDHPRVIKAEERFTEATNELMEEDAKKRVPKRLRLEQEQGSEPQREECRDGDMKDDSYLHANECQDFSASGHANEYQDFSASGSAGLGLKGSFEDSAVERKRVRENENAEDKLLRRRLREKTTTGSKRKYEFDNKDDGPERKVFVNEFEVNQEFEEDWTDIMDNFDDKTGRILDGKMVMAAEKEEVEFIEKLGVGEDSTEEECGRLKGKAPIDTKFVCVNKGSDDKPEVRVRLVTRDLLICSRQCLHWKRRKCFQASCSRRPKLERR